MDWKHFLTVTVIILFVVGFWVLVFVGCQQQLKPETITPPEKGREWQFMLSKANSLFGTLMIIGVIGLAAAVYFKEPRLLGVPAASGAGLLFLKFISGTAADILIYVCLVAGVLLIVLYAARKANALRDVVNTIEPFKEQIGEKFKEIANTVQSKETRKEVLKIRKG